MIDDLSIEIKWFKQFKQSKEVLSVNKTLLV